MNKEQQELVNEAYKNYRSKSKDIDLPENLYNKLIDALNTDAMFPIDYPNRMLTKEEFINKCKTDSEFSEKWGLKIEERELSLEERCSLANFAPFDDRFPDGDDFKWDEHTINIAEDWLKQHHPNLPTKLIIITYNNKTIENYE
jgi:hypothetical protein